MSPFAGWVFSLLTGQGYCYPGRGIGELGESQVAASWASWGAPWDCPRARGCLPQLREARGGPADPRQHPLRIQSSLLLPSRTSHHHDPWPPAWKALE